ncbi:MAG: hypothetical protein PVG78_11510 [Desulfobacterales bacterium]|jgi:hypothetical protein
MGRLRLPPNGGEVTVAIEDRPTIPGHEEIDLLETDTDRAVALLEDALKQQAESLRWIRSDFIKGVISAAELEKVEARFSEMLVEQRKILQLLRKRKTAS